MFDPKILEEEIAATNDEIGGTVVKTKSWLVNAVAMRHQSVAGDDADLAIWAIRAQVSRLVESFHRARKASELNQDDQQLVLPGYSRLQRAYLVDRDGETCSVPVHLVTDEEFAAKISEMEAMRDGLQQHIDEIRAYMERRERVSIVGDA